MTWSQIARVAFVCGIFLSTVVSPGVAGRPVLDAETARAVASYQPAWLPPEHQLDGLVVLIEPAGGGGGDSRGTPARRQVAVDGPASLPPGARGGRHTHRDAGG